MLVRMPERAMEVLLKVVGDFMEQLKPEKIAREQQALLEAVPAAGKAENPADRQPPPPQASGRGSVLDITV